MCPEMWKISFAAEVTSNELSFYEYSNHRINKKQKKQLKEASMLSTPRRDMKRRLSAPNNAVPRLLLSKSIPSIPDCQRKYEQIETPVQTERQQPMSK